MNGALFGLRTTRGVASVGPRTGRRGVSAGLHGLSTRRCVPWIGVAAAGVALALDDGVRGGVAGNCEWRAGLSSSQSCAQVCVGVINTSRVITLGVVVCDTVCSRAGGGVRGVVVPDATWGLGWGVWPP